MRNHSKSLLKRLMVVFAGIIAVFSLSGCTKSFCTNQDRANQIFAYYGNLFNDELKISEDYVDGFDYSSDNPNRVKLIQRQNKNRTTLIQNIENRANGALTGLYSFDGSFLEFMNNKAEQFVIDNVHYWTDGTLANLQVEEAKTVALHVGIYAGLETDDQNNVTGVSALWKNFDIWYEEAVNDPNIGYLQAPSINYVLNLKQYATQMTGSNTACITPVGGIFEQNDSKVYIEGKTWGQAFKEYGFLEGLLVYPLSYIVHAISTGLNNTIGAQLLAIIVVTILVRLVTVFSTISQSKMQTKQQQMQPLLNDLAKKYPNYQTDKEERQAYSMAQARIMKKYKLHPFRPLLFMIIQFPLFICVWSALQGSAALAAGNMWGLSLTTPVSQCFVNFGQTPGAAVGIVIFILMSLTNVLSSMTSLWFTSWRTKNFGNVGPTQTNADGKPVDPNKTMRIMSYVMMVFIVIMGWNLPVGMGIYWILGAVISIFQALLTEGLSTRNRHRALAHIGDGTDLAAKRRSAHHINSTKDDKKGKKSKSDKPIWR